MRWVFILLSLFCSGCASYYDSLYPYEAATKYGCKYESSGNYSCPKSIPEHFKTSNNCTWVDGYGKKDGTLVTGHMRCKIGGVSSYSKSSGSNCHYVSGYYRKNGTYVKGHTRCR